MHPMVLSDNPAHTKRRATAIHIKDCGCLIRRIYMEGNDVIGEIETLSNRNGQDIANLVARDKVNIGFSLRALGGVKTDPDGTVIVQLPIRAITYDIVSNPSHASARIVEYLPESCSEVNSLANGDIMYESADSSDVQFLVEQDSININNQINLEESNFIKSIINDQFNNAVRHIRFKF